MLLADVSASGAFGTVRRRKAELIAEFCAVLAFAAVNNNDRIGLILFSDRVEKYVPPKKGVTHVLRVIRELLYHSPRGRGTDISAALEFLSRVTIRQTVAFLVSDFFASGYEHALRIAAKRHDLIAVAVGDPRERVLPDVGIIELEDPETGEMAAADTGDPRVREGFARIAAGRDRARDLLLASCGIDCITVSTAEPYARELLGFFKRREKRMAV